jgi:hypothetical protein
MPFSSSAFRLPLRVLLRSFLREAERPPAGDRADAIRAASASWLSAPAFPQVPTADLTRHVAEFAARVSPLPWHALRLAMHAGFVRHGVNHLRHAHDPLSLRFDRCVSPRGTYTVPGGGRAFWAAVVKATAPDRLPDWTPDVENGLDRTGVFPAGCDRLAIADDVYASLLRDHPTLTAWDLDHFFRRVARIRGRSWDRTDAPEPLDAIRDRVRAVRVHTPLKKRLTTSGEELAALRKRFDAALQTDYIAGLADVLDRLIGTRFALNPRRVKELLASGPESASFDEFAALGTALPAALLHLHDPKAHPPWRPDLPAALADLDDAFHPTLPPREQYALYRDVAAGLRERFGVHPLEVADVVAARERPTHDPTPRADRTTFHGFAPDTFRFFAELGEHNEKAWMDTRRDDYRCWAREPMVELCAAVAERFVGPVLATAHGWDLETDPRAGKALTSITKNDYGRSGPYTPELWVTFYRRALGGKRHDVQLFVKADAGGVSFGFHLGRSARDAGKRFRAAVQAHGEKLYRAVQTSGAADGFTFRGATTAFAIRTAADLRAWAAEKELFAERHFQPDHPLLSSDDLVGEILIGFDRLVPLFAAAVDDDPLPVLAKRAGDAPDAPPFDREAFHQATFLSDLWLARTLDLLTLKKQLILHGVPGTGKTHVARCLARLLTADRPGTVRLVQFHPAYSYEEFVEGIRPRTVEANGRTEVTYPVEPGVLCEFAAAAEARPSVPHVLLVDEINRGNLPRIFGELLFLLEYRDQEVTLPHSRRPFRLPANLYLVGTMNAADRSTAALDQALRRRFSFVEMPADAAVLAGWLEQNLAPLPQGRGEQDDTFGPRVVHLFEELNRRLARDIGPDRQIGHSFFMVPGLTDESLRAVWDHHVRPTLADYFATRGVPPGYDLDKLLGTAAKKKRETA